MRQLSAQKAVQDELLQRFRQIQKRLSDLRFEADEVTIICRKFSFLKIFFFQFRWEKCVLFANLCKTDMNF